MENLSSLQSGAALPGVLNFSLQRRSPGRHGLRMGLSPGRYRRKESLNNCILISEAAFGPLEEAILNRYPRYRNYGHWGVSEIPRDDWRLIIEDWRELKVRLQSGGTLSERAVQWFSNEQTTDIAQRALPTNIQGLLKLIEEVSEWVGIELETNDVVTVLGI